MFFFAALKVTKIVASAEQNDAWVNVSFSFDNDSDVGRRKFKNVACGSVNGADH